MNRNEIEELLEQYSNFEKWPILLKIDSLMLIASQLKDIVYGLDEKSVMAFLHTINAGLIFTDYADKRANAIEKFKSKNLTKTINHFEKTIITLASLEKYAELEAGGDIRIANKKMAQILADLSNIKRNQPQSFHETFTLTPINEKTGERTLTKPSVLDGSTYHWFVRPVKSRNLIRCYPQLFAIKNAKDLTRLDVLRIISRLMITRLNGIRDREDFVKKIMRTLFSKDGEPDEVKNIRYVAIVIPLYNYRPDEKDPRKRDAAMSIEIPDGYSFPDEAMIYRHNPNQNPKLETPLFPPKKSSKN